jgi:succinate-semialdehyde dehydrogenase / glutarate-semialdehyde dehydrogenase
MSFISINPYNGTAIEEISEQTTEQVDTILRNADESFSSWRQTSFSQRAKVLTNAAALLLEHIEKYAHVISLEMGKPIAESRAEIKKCAWVCEYYASNSEAFLQTEIIKTDAQESFVRLEPMGCILAIMPWNFPFWQVFRFAAPSLMAGNVCLLKHAPNVFRSALNIEEIFEQAGCPKGVFQNLIIHHDNIKGVIENPIVKAVSLTGSERAGASVASIAGQNIKKTLLELGGSNAFIVSDDADIDKAVEIGVKARMMNSGQSCIAAKRFIVLEAVYESFLSKFVDAVKSLKSGDPLDESTQIGPLARVDLADQLNSQVQESVKQGATIVVGGIQNGAYFAPTVMTDIQLEMPVFAEETFGPVAPIIKVKDLDEAIRIAEHTKFGLGISLFTNDIDKAKKYISKVSDGAFFINALVKSDPRLPFGGTKYSGYGRELAKEGVLEFVNKKTVYIA